MGIKSWLFTEDEDDNAEKNGDGTQVNGDNAQINEVAQSTPVQKTYTSTGVASSEIVQAILQDNINAAGDCPYVTFSTAVASMESDVPDEGTRYKAALAVLRVSKIDSASIIASASEVISMIDKDKIKKNGALEEQWKSGVTNLEEQDAANSKAIEELAVKLRELQDLKTELAGKIAVNRSKLTEARGTIEQAYAAAGQTIQNNIQKLKIYAGIA